MVAYTAVFLAVPGDCAGTLVQLAQLVQRRGAWGGSTGRLGVGPASILRSPQLRVRVPEVLQYLPLPRLTLDRALQGNPCLVVPPEAEKDPPVGVQERPVVGFDRAGVLDLAEGLL